jgi:hypothetical protein
MSMLDRFGTNPTQLTGLLSFALATTACLSAGRRSTPGDKRIWNALAFINGLLLLDILFGFRFRILGFARVLLRAEGLYDQLHGWAQGIIVVLVATIALACGLLFLFRRQVAGGPARIAAGITIVVLGIFAIEALSLHEIDAVYYRPIGPVLTVGWLWAIGAVGICSAAACVRRRSDRD